MLEQNVYIKKTSEFFNNYETFLFITIFNRLKKVRLT